MNKKSITISVFIYFILYSTSTGFSQIGESRWVDFGMGESKYDTTRYLNFHMQFSGHKFNNWLISQYGLNTSFTIMGNSEHYTYVHYSFGTGCNNRYVLAGIFFGPSIYAVSYRQQKLDLVNEGIKFGLGLNSNSFIVFKPFPKLGLGVEYSANYSKMKSIQSLKFIVIFSNGK